MSPSAPPRDDAENVLGARAARVSAVCTCGHHDTSHPFGSSGYLFSDGRCSQCACASFVDAQVERVARAIYEASEDDPLYRAWEYTPERRQRMFRVMARAAMTAIRNESASDAINRTTRGRRPHDG